MFKKSMLFMGSLLLMASSVFAANPFEVSIWERYAEGLGWAVVASIGFSSRCCYCPEGFRLVLIRYRRMGRDQKRELVCCDDFCGDDHYDRTFGSQSYLNQLPRN